MPALWEFEAGGEPVARPGERSIILDGRGEPLCVVETTEVEVRRFDEVDEEFARDEGEGDLSLAYWREAHRRFFAGTFGDRMPFLRGHAARVRAISGDLQTGLALRIGGER
ncbi:MAG: hypothetical protein AVDCRST_MAG22-2125 [uncultured Rubrobacteraceae bacterium]|uniref:ASCH domain-containing protein n=1 Tax=uncultured Rubrobacteraceae bacterium TaxID=349277 RepID=A0A6J4PH91_9ACTN|nr:MAG: hypothetical protein AVDCRST_MAG22-2125 [uncultured Rubrobacteraceae bacterium]